MHTQKTSARASDTSSAHDTRAAKTAGPGADVARVLTRVVAELRELRRDVHDISNALNTTNLKISGLVRRSSSRRLVSDGELAKDWSVHPTTVGRILGRAGLKPYYLHDGDNGTKRWNRKEVDAYVASCRES